MKGGISYFYLIFEVSLQLDEKRRSGRMTEKGKSV